MDTEGWKTISDIVKTIIQFLGTITGVGLGWYLGTLSQRRHRRLDNLQNRLAALREVMYIAADIPPDLVITELQDRLCKDSAFCNSLAHRLVRLFGLRTELTPYLEPEIRRFIDFTFRPLFRIGIGSYELLPEKVNEFARAAIELRRLATNIEQKLIEENERLIR